MTNRENLLAILRHEKPERIPRLGDSAYAVLAGDQSPYSHPAEDSWGVRWIPTPVTGQMVDESVPPILTDITKWREQIKIPDPRTLCDWQAEAAAKTAAWDRENQLLCVHLLEGHFERLHDLMGFEEALCVFYDEDGEDDLRALFAAMTENRIRGMEIAKKYYNPDVIIYHDDWGTDRSLFFSPDIWRSFIKPEFIRLVNAAHELGMYFELHSCGHVQELVGELAEDTGVDILQPLQYPQNDIRMIKASYGERLVIRGGYDGRRILRKDVPDGEKRATIRESLGVLAPGGNHIPYYVSFGEAPEHAMEVFNGTIAEFEKENGPC